MTPGARKESKIASGRFWSDWKWKHRAWGYLIEEYLTSVCMAQNQKRRSRMGEGLERAWKRGEEKEGRERRKENTLKFVVFG